MVIEVGDGRLGHQGRLVLLARPAREVRTFHNDIGVEPFLTDPRTRSGRNVPSYIDAIDQTV